MSRASLTIEKRDASGKSPTARRTRKQGRVPGVVYHQDGNIPFSVDELEVAAVLRKGATLVDANLEGKEHLTVIKEVQTHPVRGDVMHLDLQAVTMDQKVRTTVPLHLNGIAPGIKEGGVLTQGIRDLYIECKASEIPESIDFDISTVHAGDTKILSEIPRSNDIRFLDDPGTMVIAINVPRGAKKGAQAAAASEEAAAEA